MGIAINAHAVVEVSSQCCTMELSTKIIVMNPLLLDLKLYKSVTLACSPKSSFLLDYCILLCIKGVCFNA